jgi:hypothetical protein
LNIPGLVAISEYTNRRAAIGSGLLRDHVLAIDQIFECASSVPGAASRMAMMHWRSNDRLLILADISGIVRHCNATRRLIPRAIGGLPPPDCHLIQEDHRM